LKTGDVAEADRVLRHHIQSVVGEDLTPSSGAVREARPRMTPALDSLWRRVQGEDARLPDITTLPLDSARRQFDAVNVRWNARARRATARIEAFTIPAPPREPGSAGHGIEAVRVSPPGRRRALAGTILHLHGGGWVFGNNGTHRGAMARLAERTGCEVIGIDYGLAPEHPFPHGLNDCSWAWRWLRAQPQQGAADRPWFVAGDSAGANLALAMIIDLRQAGEPLPDAALLFYGVYDADHATASHLRCGDGSFGLSSAKMAWYRAHYLAGGASAEDPRVSPLRAALHDLPPLFVSAAELDPLQDDSAALAARLAEAGVSHEFKRYAGVHHGFMQMADFLPEADQAFDDAAAFLRARWPGSR